MSSSFGGRRWTATDLDGREVVLTSERWTHVVAGHPELTTLESSIRQAITSPTRRFPGRSPTQGWYYVELQRPRRSRWPKVVVSYGEQGGWIVTAFLRRSLP